jgi:uncharacterized protein (DUF305 family)
MKIRSVLIFTACAAFPLVALAQEPATQAFTAAMDKMMTGMHMEATGDADKDFAMMMIPHHQGAIDMAKVELQYGDDPQLRELAQVVIDAQEKEIVVLKEWLQKNP